MSSATAETQYDGFDIGDLSFATSRDAASVTGLEAVTSTTTGISLSLQPITAYSGRYDETPFWETIYGVSKRMIDIVLSVCALVLLSPIFLIAALLIFLHDRGPMIFCQTRVGKDGRPFCCFKFRSMILNAQALQDSLMEQSEHDDPRTFKMVSDPRITPPGRILRRLSIDELPQILNVLRGDMSIVGPRPPLPSEVRHYSRTDYQRLAVKPGLTCLWQISGRARLPFPDQVRLDLEYIRTRSLTKDIAIILKTIPAVLSGDGAS